MRLAVVLCLLSMAACSRLGYHPPAGSYRMVDFAFSADGVSQTVHGVYVRPAFFQEAKIRPLIGRLFLPQEYQSGGVPVVVICHRFWQQSLKGDPRCIGSTVQLNGRNFTIVGVTPATFAASGDLWAPETK